MAGLSWIYLPSDGSPVPVHERVTSLPLHNRPPQARPLGASILLVDHNDENALRILEDTFEELPVDMVQNVGSNAVFQLPQPQVSIDAAPVGLPASFCSILKFQGLDGDSIKYANGYDVSAEEISKDANSVTTVGTWISKAAVVSNTTKETLILLVLRPESRHVRQVAHRLEVYFQEHPLDLFELRSNPLFIYVALYYCLNNFTTILFQYENIYRQVALSQERNTTGIFARTYQCNKCLVSMSYCQQDILAHKAVLENLAALVKHDRALLRPREQDSTYRLEQDVRILKEDLEDFKAKLDILTDRIQATLDLDFNLSGERLNIIVLWFTIITVIFTPLGFVAAVFSVVETDPVYFLIALMLTLLVSLGVVLWLYSSVMHLGQGLRRQHLHKLIYHLPYKEKLGFSGTGGSDKPDSGSSSNGRKTHSGQHNRPSTSDHPDVESSVGSGSSSNSDPAPRPPRPPPAMSMPYTVPPPMGPGAPPGKYQHTGRPPPPPGYSTSAAARPSTVYVNARTSGPRRRRQQRRQSNMGSLSYSRRPTTSTAPRETEQTNTYFSEYVERSCAREASYYETYDEDRPSSSRRPPPTASYAYGPPPPPPATYGYGPLPTRRERAEIRVVSPGPASERKPSSRPRSGSDHSSDR